MHTVFYTLGVACSREGGIQPGGVACSREVADLLRQQVEASGAGLPWTWDAAPRPMPCCTMATTHSGLAVPHQRYRRLIREGGPRGRPVDAQAPGLTVNVASVTHQANHREAPLLAGDGHPTPWRPPPCPLCVAWRGRCDDVMVATAQQAAAAAAAESPAPAPSKAAEMAQEQPVPGQQPSGVGVVPPPQLAAAETTPAETEAEEEPAPAGSADQPASADA